MPFSGGVWTAPSLPGSFNPAVAGSSATPTDWNTLLTAISDGISTMICKDGQSIVSNNIPFAGFKLTGVGAGTLVTDAPNLGQIQSGAGVYAADTGTAEAHAIAPSPAISAYVVGQSFRWKVAAANLTTTPTLAVNGLTAGIVSWDNAALRAGDLPLNGLVETIVATVVAGTPTFHLQTPPAPIAAVTTTPTVQVFTSGSAATYTTPAGVKWIRVLFAAGGGGGAGAGQTTAPDGTIGNDTSFNSIVAAAGLGGKGTTNVAVTTPAGGLGGTGGSGSTNVVKRFPGNDGGAGNNTGAAGAVSSGAGAAGPFGGSVAGSAVASGANGTSAIAGTGAGGAGAGGVGATQNAGGGGGSGEFVTLIIGAPAATYTYTVGAGGAGGIGTGVGAFTGGAGASGFIIVEEYYVP